MNVLPLLFFFGSLALPVQAEVFKCMVGTRTIYQDHPCSVEAYGGKGAQPVEPPQVIAVTNSMPAAVPRPAQQAVPMSYFGLQAVQTVQSTLWSMFWKVMLPIMLFMLLVKVGLRYLKNKLREGQSGQQVAKKVSMDWFDRDRPFTRKKRLLSPSEAVMLEKLRLVFPARQFEVFPCVRLADVIEIDLPEWQTKNRARELNDIARMHIDYVICRKTSSDILAAVELDDPSHDNLKAVTRDTRKDLALNAAGVKLYRFRAEDDDSYRRMKEEILGMTSATA